MANLLNMKGDEYAAVIGKLAPYISPTTGRVILDLKDQEVLKGIGRLIEERLRVSGRITVPNLSASALVAQAKKKLNLTYLSSDLAGWNFVTDEGGRTYEVLTQKFGHIVSSDTVRAYFHDRVFKGNAAALVAWVTQKNPKGYYTSIPEDDKLCPVPGSRDLCAPYFYRDGSCRLLRLGAVQYGWSDDWVFVGFREILKALDSSVP